MLESLAKGVALGRSFFQGQDRTARAGRQVGISFFLQAISILVSLMYVRLLLNFLSKENYGIWLTLTSILGWVSFFDIGVGNGLRNKLSEALANNDIQLGKRYVSTAYAIISGTFLFVLLVFSVTNHHLNWKMILNSTSESAVRLTALTSIVFTFFVLRFIVQLIGVIYTADHNPSINNGVNALSNVVSLIAVYCLTKTDLSGDLVILGAIISITPVLLYVLLSVRAFRGKYKGLKPTLSSVDLKLSGGLMSLGVKFFMLQVTSIIIFSTASIFISHFYGPEEVVTYNVVFKYYQLPVMLSAIILTPFWSAVTDAFVKDDFGWLKKAIKRLNLITLCLVVLILLMTVASSLFFRLWLGDKLAISPAVLTLMSIYSILNVFNAPFAIFINGTGKIKLTVSFTFAQILVYFTCAFVFCHIFKDSAGMVLAIIVASLIGVCIQPLQTYKILNKKASGIWYK